MVPGFYKKPWIIIVICAAITVFFGLQLPNLIIENSARDFHPKQGESYLRFEKNEEEFGSMDAIGIALETKTKASILEPEYLGVTKKIVDDIESLDLVEKIDSIANMDYVCTDSDGALVSEKLIPEDSFETQTDGKIIYKGSDKDILTLRRKLVEWDEMYNRVIISDDFKATQIAVSLKGTVQNDKLEDIKVTNTQKDQLLQEIREILDKDLAGSDLSVTTYGGPVISDECHTYMLSDLLKLIPLVVVVVVLCLFFSFKTVDGTLLPLLSVLVSTVWSMGAMALFKVPFTIVSSIIPVALIAVGSAYGIHVLTHYYIELEKNDKPMTKELHAELIWKGIKDVFVAVLLAGITTIVGFISLITSPIDPLHGFAVFTSTGVFVSLLLSVTLIPAMLLIKPISKVGKKSAKIEAVLQKAKDKAAGKLEKISKKNVSGEADPEMSTYYKFFRFFTGTRPRLIIFVVVIAVLSGIGIRHLIIDTATINYFPAESKLRQDVNYVNDRFAGTNSVYVVVSVEETEEEKAKRLEYEKAKAEQEKAASEKVVKTASSDDSFDDFDDFGSSLTSTASSSGDSFDDFDSFDTFDETSESSNAVAKSAAPALPEYKPRNMTDPEILTAIEGLQQDLVEHFPEVGTAVSFTTILKRINQVMNSPQSLTTDMKKTPNIAEIIELLNEVYATAGGSNTSIEDIITLLEKRYNYNGWAFNEIPADAAKYNVKSTEDLAKLVSQYIVLLGGDTLDRFALPKGSFEPTKLRIQIQLRENSSHEVGKIIDYMKKYIDGGDGMPAHFPKGYKVEYTGNGEMDYAMTNMIVSSQLTSLIISLVSVFIIIAISFKSGWAGLLGALPLALTIILNYMIMGFAGIRLDLVTSIIASVAIGVGIDYTIHFMETFHAERLLSDDMTGVLKRTFLKSGRGIMTNALAVGLGFLVLCFSEFVVLRYIGILVAIVMFTSSALALTIIPGILNLHDPKFMKSKNKNNSEKSE